MPKNNKQIASLLIGIDVAKSQEMMARQMRQLQEELQKSTEGLKLNVGLDASQIGKEMAKTHQQLNSERKSIDVLNISPDQARVIEQLKKTYRQLGDIGVQSISEISNGYGSLKATIKDSGNEVKTLSASFKQMPSGEIAFQETTRSITDMDKRMKQTKATVNKYGSALKNNMKHMKDGVNIEQNAILAARNHAKIIEENDKAHRALNAALSSNVINKKEYTRLKHDLNNVISTSTSQFKDFDQQLADAKGFKEQKEWAEEYRATLKEIDRLSRLKSKGDFTSTDETQLQNLRQYSEEMLTLNELQDINIELVEKTNKLNDEATRFDRKQKELDYIERLNAALSKQRDIYQRLQRVESKFGKDHSLTQNLQQEYQKSQKTVQELNREKQRMPEITQANSTKIKNILEKESQFYAIQEHKKIEETESRFKQIVGMTREAAEKANRRMTDVQYQDFNELTSEPESLDRMAKSLDGTKAKVDSFNTAKRELTTVVQQADGRMKKNTYHFDEHSKAVYRSNTKIGEAIHRKMKFGEAIRHAATRMAQWVSVGALMNQTLRRLRDGFRFVTEMDTQLTQTAIIQRNVRASTNELGDQYLELGRQLQRSSGEVAELTTELMRQGLAMEESLARTQTIIQLSTAGMVEVSQAMRIITASVNAMQVSHENAGDVILRTSQITASSVDQIGEAFTKTAASAHAAGLSIEQTSALLSGMIETTQEGASQIGTSMKTILARFNAVNQETGEMNEELNQVQTAFESVGIAFTNQEGQIRNAYDLLGELADIWETLDRNTQAYLATTTAGVRMQSRFFAIMSSFDKIAETQEDLVDSAGILNEGYETALEGIDANLKALQVSWEELYHKIWDSEFINSLIKIAMQFVEVLKGITEGLQRMAPVLKVITFAFEIVLKTITILVNFAPTQIAMVVAITAQTAKYVSMLAVLINLKRKSLALTLKEQGANKISLGIQKLSLLLRTKNTLAIKAEGVALTKLNTIKAKGLLLDQKTIAAYIVQKGRLKTLIALIKGATAALIAKVKAIGALIGIKGALVIGTVALVGGLGYLIYRSINSKDRFEELNETMEYTQRQLVGVGRQARDLNRDLNNSKQSVDDYIESLKALGDLEYLTDAQRGELDAIQEQLIQEFPELELNVDGSVKGIEDTNILRENLEEILATRQKLEGFQLLGDIAQTESLTDNLQQQRRAVANEVQNLFEIPHTGSETTENLFKDLRDVLTAENTQNLSITVEDQQLDDMKEKLLEIERIEQELDDENLRTFTDKYELDIDLTEHDFYSAISKLRHNLVGNFLETLDENIQIDPSQLQPLRTAYETIFYENEALIEELFGETTVDFSLDIVPEGMDTRMFAGVVETYLDEVQDEIDEAIDKLDEDLSDEDRGKEIQKIIMSHLGEWDDGGDFQADEELQRQIEGITTAADGADLSRLRQFHKEFSELRIEDVDVEADATDLAKQFDDAKDKLIEEVMKQADIDKQDAEIAVEFLLESEGISQIDPSQIASRYGILAGQLSNFNQQIREGSDDLPQYLEYMDKFAHGTSFSAEEITQMMTEIEGLGGHLQRLADGTYDISVEGQALILAELDTKSVEEMQKELHRALEKIGVQISLEDLKDLSHDEMLGLAAKIDDTEAREEIEELVAYIETTRTMEIQAEVEYHHEQMDDAVSTATAYNDILKEINDTGEIGFQTQQKIIQNKPELLRYMNDEAALYSELKKLIAEESRAYKDAAIEKLKYCEHFLQQIVDGNTTMAEKLGKIYGKDSDDWRTLHQAKLDIVLDTVKKASKYWERFYDVETNELKADHLEQYLGRDNAAFKYLYEEYNKVAKAYREINEELEREVLDLSGIKPISFDLDTSGGGTGSEFAQEFDLMARKIKMVGREIEKIDHELDHTFGYDRTALFNKKAALTTQKIDTMSRAATKYGELADEAFSKIPPSVAIRVKQGEIARALEITSQEFGDQAEEINAAIEAYEQFSDAAYDTMRTQMDLQQSMIDTKIQEFTNRMDMLGLTTDTLNHKLQVLDMRPWLNETEVTTQLTEHLEATFTNVREELEALTAAYEQGSISLEEYTQLSQEKTAVLRRTEIELNRLHREEETRRRDELNTLQDVERKVIEMIRNRVELQKQALDEEFANFERYINDRMRLLDDQFSEEDFARDLGREQERAREIQRDIDNLRLDDSEYARDMRLGLEKELHEQTERIEDMHRNRSRDKQRQALQDSLDIERERVDGEKARLDEQLEDHNLYSEARQAILNNEIMNAEGEFVKLTDAYIEFEDRFGEGMSILGDLIKNDFLASLEEVASLIESGRLDDLSGTSKTTEEFVSSPDSSSEQDPIANQPSAERAAQHRIANLQNLWMNRFNSLDEETRQNWEQDNQLREWNEEAEALREQFNIPYEDLTHLLGGSFNNGGIITENQIAALHGSESDWEAVLTKPQISELMKRTIGDTLAHITPESPSVTIGNMVSIQGNVDQNNVQQVKQAAENSVQQLVKRLKMAGVR